MRPINTHRQTDRINEATSIHTDRRTKETRPDKYTQTKLRRLHQYTHADRQKKRGHIDSIKQTDRRNKAISIHISDRRAEGIRPINTHRQTDKGTKPH